MNTIDILKTFLPFWQQLEPSQQLNIVNNSRIIDYSKNQHLYSCDSECLGVLFVIKGSLRVYLLSEEGKEVTLYRIAPKQVCVMSASCIIKNITFDVNITAEVDSQILLINASSFEALQNKNVYVKNFALSAAVDRFSEVINAFEQMLFYKFDKRLAIFLLDETARLGTDTINLTHESIAKYIGSAREVVSRTLKTFEKMGIVSLKSGQVTVINRKQLNSING